MTLSVLSEKSIASLIEWCNDKQAKYNNRYHQSCSQQMRDEANKRATNFALIAECLEELLALREEDEDDA